VIGFKCFMGNTFGNLPAPSDGAMLEGFEIWARHGMALHRACGNRVAILARRRSPDAREPAGPTRSPISRRVRRSRRMEAVQRAALYAEWTGARLHIAHVSSADELRPLREAKARGVDVTAEPARIT